MSITVECRPLQSISPFLIQPAVNVRKTMSARWSSNRNARATGRILLGVLCVGLSIFAGTHFLQKAESIQSSQLPLPTATHMVLLSDKAINESSGLVLSQRNEDCFWTHNDSGDIPRLFLVHRDGRSIAHLRVMGVNAIDWEDIARATIGGSEKLIIADIGGNAQSRKFVTLHVVTEPHFRFDPNLPEASTKAPIEATVKVDTTIQVQFKGGVTNYEGIAVDHAAGLILIVEKALFGGRVFTVPLPAVADLGKDKTEVMAKEIGQTTIPFACACDISHDDNALVVTNYTLGYLYARQALDGGVKEEWSETLKREPIVFRLPKLRQPEAVCFSKDSRSVFLTSEQQPTPLVEISLPATR